LSSNPAHEEIKDNVSVVAAEADWTLEFQNDRDKCPLPDNHTLSFHCEFLSFQVSGKTMWLIDVHDIT
jgi:hypothetical protein